MSSIILNITWEQGTEYCKEEGNKESESLLDIDNRVSKVIVNRSIYNKKDKEISGNSKINNKKLLKYSPIQFVQSNLLVVLTSIILLQ